MNDVVTKISRIARLLTKDNQLVLLSTIGINGWPRSRYMGAFRIRDRGEFFFISPSTATKMQEIYKNPKVQVVFSSKNFQRILALSGNACVVQDISLRQALYEETKPLEIYPVFNDDFGVIRFVPALAEYLDLNVSYSPVVISIPQTSL